MALWNNVMNIKSTTSQNSGDWALAAALGGLTKLIVDVVISVVNFSNKRLQTPTASDSEHLLDPRQTTDGRTDGRIDNLATTTRPSVKTAANSLTSRMGTFREPNDAFKVFFTY